MAKGKFTPFAKGGGKPFGKSSSSALSKPAAEPDGDEAMETSKSMPPKRKGKSRPKFLSKGGGR
jgi:hypothetical protein